MRNVIDALVGRDVARKLYSVNDVANMSSSASAAQQNSSLSPIGKGNSTMRRGAGLDFRRTVSVDAIHTGGKGHLRSLQWIRDANLTEINAGKIFFCSPNWLNQVPEATFMFQTNVSYWLTMSLTFHLAWNTFRMVCQSKLSTKTSWPKPSFWLSSANIGLLAFYDYISSALKASSHGKESADSLSDSNPSSSLEVKSSSSSLSDTFSFTFKVNLEMSVAELMHT